MTFELSCKVIPMNSHVKSFPNSGIQNDPTCCMPLSEQICLVLGGVGNTLPATRRQSVQGNELHTHLISFFAVHTSERRCMCVCVCVCV